MKLVPISTVPTDEIEPDPLNPNSMKPKQQKALSDTIDKFGYAQEIWVRKVGGKYRIIDGEHRWNYLKENGIKDAPVRIFKVNETDAILLRQISFNLRGQQSLPKSAEELKILFEAKKFDDFLKYTAADRDKNEIILENRFKLLDRPECKEVTDAKELKTKHKVEAGKLYRLGDHLILCGDCTDPENYAALLGSDKVTMMLTDPPYGVNISHKIDIRPRTALTTVGTHETGIMNDNMKDYATFIGSMLAPIQWAEYSAFYVFTMGKELPRFQIELEKIGNVSQTLVWDKGRFVMGRKDFQSSHELILYGWPTKHQWHGDRSTISIISHSSNARNVFHPTEKPVAMLCNFVRYSSRKGDIVYDPFGGGGATLLAAEQTGRKARIMELDPQYISTTIHRWEEYTGRKHEAL